ncbi:hypothetical protein CR513_53199, partial [Mucuna pruriens]
MALVAHFDLKVHQMYAQTTLLNNDLYEDLFWINLMFGFKENAVDQCIYLKNSGNSLFLSWWHFFDLGIKIHRYRSQRFVHILILLLQLVYLGDTRDNKKYWFTYKRSNHLGVIGYSNFDYGGCPTDYKLTSEYIFMLAIGVVSGKTLTTTLIVEAKYVACNEYYSFKTIKTLNVQNILTPNMFVREKVQEFHTCIEYIPTKLM